MHLLLERLDQPTQFLLRQRPELTLDLVPLALSPTVLARHRGRAVGPQHRQDVADRLADGLRIDAVLLVVGHLQQPSSLRLADRSGHRIGDPVGIHDHLTADVPGRATDHLDQRRLGPEEALLVGVEDADQRHLGKIESLAEEVDADQHIELAQPERTEDLDPLDGVDVGVEVPHPKTLLEQVVGEILGHLLGERGDEHPLVLRHPIVDQLHQIVDLSLGGLDDDLGVDEAGRSDDLFDHLCRHAELVLARRGGEEDRLVDPLEHLFERERPVVAGRREPEAVFDEDVLATAVARELAVELRDRDVALVDHEEEVVREVVEQRERRFAVVTPVDVHRVVLDPVAVADLADHLEVVLGPHPKALCLEQLALLLELLEAHLEFVLDLAHGDCEPLVAGDVMRGREDDRPLHLLQRLAGERVDPREAVDRVAEHLDAQHRLLVGGMDLDRVAANPELAPAERGIVAVVLHVDQATQDAAHVVVDAVAEIDELALVLVGIAHAVDAADRRDDDRVAPREQGRGGGVPEAIDLVVDRRVLLDEGVTGRDVRLGLVVVVVADEVLDPVVREELPHLLRELRRQ